MKIMKSVKCNLLPQEIERRSLSNEQLRTIFNMHRIDKTEKLHDRLDRYDKKRHSTRRKS